MVFLATKLDTAPNSLVVEMKALAWALETTKSLHWSRIEWSSDTQVMINEINSTQEPL